MGLEGKFVPIGKRWFRGLSLFLSCRIIHFHSMAFCSIFAGNSVAPNHTKAIPFFMQTVLDKHALKIKLSSVLECSGLIYQGLDWTNIWPGSPKCYFYHWWAKSNLWSCIMIMENALTSTFQPLYAVRYWKMTMWIVNTIQVMSTSLTMFERW